MRSAMVIAALTIAGAASADSVRFDWTGTVSFADPTLASAGIFVGTPAVGHYRFESTTPDSDPDPEVGFYDLALLQWRVAVGLIDNTTTLPGFGSITVWLDFEGMGDIYEVRVGPAIVLRLQDLDGTAFASDALPTTPPELAAFEGAGLAQLDPNTLQPLVVIDLDTLTLTPPSIPALPLWGAPTIVLLTLLAGRFGGWRPRRDSKLRRTV